MIRGASDMQDYEVRHMEHARVRSADAAVFKAVEHEAALERKAVRSAQPKHVASSSKRVSSANESQLYGIKKILPLSLGKGRSRQAIRQTLECLLPANRYFRIMFPAILISQRSIMYFRRPSDLR